MKFVKLNLNGTYHSTLDAMDSIEVQGVTKQVQSLTPEEKYELRLQPLVLTSIPSFDPRSHWVREIEPSVSQGVCTQSWQVLEHSAEQAADNYNFAKSTKRDLINAWRAQANQTSFTHAGKQIECDALSRSDIDAVAGNVALTGSFPAGFPNAWKTLDNSYIELPTVQSFKDMYASMTLQGTINFGKAQDLKAELDAASTFAEIDAVRWS
jgi:Domain of unknown function (DUF4376)